MAGLVAHSPLLAEARRQVQFMFLTVNSETDSSLLR